ncbi:Transcription factor GRAS1 [Heracleum sosnowskyi]|uniref:Transcription factor GRAS1 n=1 Tax=Heracleum sosnowskyi TaxID=360622 RepID=A0AAD8LZR8_9APIA|nr:Transcription factor GRAS1 [Heracleum sosnowskyi]
MADDFSLNSVFDTQGVYKPLEDILNEALMTRPEQIAIFGIDKPARADPSTDVIRFVRHPTDLADARVHPPRDKEKYIFNSRVDFNLKDNNSVNTMQLDQSILQGQNHELSSDGIHFINLKPSPISTESFRVLGNYRKGKVRSREGRLSDQSSSSTVNDKKLSTEDIIRMAGEKFIHLSSKKHDGFTSFNHPYDSSLSSLSLEDAKMVDLANLLLASAEKVGYKQFDAAYKLLMHCEGMVSESGHPVERIAFHFSKALRERIKTGLGSNLDKIGNDQGRPCAGPPTGIDFATVVLHQEVPFSKVMQFVSIQTILDNVAVAKRIHLIDLQLRNGVQWTLFIQALSERKIIPVKLLKITAIQTSEKDRVEEIGKRLQSYAKSMNISFIFKVVSVLNMKDLNVELLDIRHGEAVAVYSPVVLKTMIRRPENLQSLLGVIQRLRPVVMVVMEVEANTNSPLFVNRFIEALFWYSAWFDSLEDCIARDNQYRMEVERSYFGRGIQNIVAAEGEDRTARSVEINVWRTFFQRFKMVEIDISKASLDQANMVLKQKFSCGSSCTIYKNRKCLIVGWKGTPLHSVSAWKFK